MSKRKSKSKPIEAAEMFSRLVLIDAAMDGPVPRGFSGSPSDRRATWLALMDALAALRKEQR